MALRFGAKVPELHEDSPLARLWIDKIADLPAALRQGRLAATALPVPEALAITRHVASKHIFGAHSLKSWSGSSDQRL